MARKAPSSNSWLAQLNSDLDQIEASIQTKIDASIAAAKRAMYPVGAIYINVSNTNPGTFLGGTWVAWGTGQVPVGVDTTQTEFNTVEKTGGEKTHQLTAAESGVPAEGGGVVYQQDSGAKYFNVGSDADATHRANLLTGGVNAAQAHNNLQPYITCYMFKRTA